MLTMDKLRQRLEELIGMVVRGVATNYDLAELRMLQQMRVKMLTPSRTK
jgi:hypothetical protein